MEYPFALREIRLHDFVNPVVKCTVSQILETRKQSTLDLSPVDFKFLVIAILEIAMSCNFAP
jgi:hypothetical protein